MKRTQCSLGLAAVSLFMVVLASSAFGQGIRVELNDRQLWFDQPPAMIGGRLMVPLRGIFEALNSDVRYDGPTRSIKATKGSTVVELTLGSREARVNGRSVYLDVPADTLGGRTMVPLRFVSEALGAEVKWEGVTKTVRISDGGATAPVPQPPPTGRGPTIDQVIHNATGPLQAGDTVDVVMTGDPGGQASFEILGVTGSIRMREAGNGRYEGRYTVPQGVSVKQGVFTGRLLVGGRESIAESSRAITIETAKPAQQLNVLQFSPPHASAVTTPRPTIGALFSAPLAGGSVRVLVDNRDMTAQARVNGQQVMWAPPYNLAPGQHTARVAVSDPFGNSANFDWSFTIQAQPASTGLRVNNLQNGNFVSGIFRVQGQAAPGALITIQTAYGMTTTGGGVQDRTLWARGIADANGRFDIEVDAEQVPPGGSMQLTVTSSAPPASQSLQLRRQ